MTCGAGTPLQTHTRRRGVPLVRRGRLGHTIGAVPLREACDIIPRPSRHGPLLPPFDPPE